VPRTTCWRRGTESQRASELDALASGLSHAAAIPIDLLLVERQGLSTGRACLYVELPYRTDMTACCWDPVGSPKQESRTTLNADPAGTTYPRGIEVLIDNPLGGT